MSELQEHAGREPLHRRVLLDALATRFDAATADALADRVLSRSGPPREATPEALPAYVRSTLRRSLIDVLGQDDAGEVLEAALALSATLLVARRIPRREERGPYILLADRPTALERVLDLRRVDSIFDVIGEASSSPTAILVVDGWAELVRPETFALALEELPQSVRVVVVGASDEFRSVVESMTKRFVAFDDEFAPLGMVRRASARVGVTSSGVQRRPTLPLTKAA